MEMAIKMWKAIAGGDYIGQW